MLENLILIFMENIQLFFFIIAVVCFIIPMIYISVRRKKRKIKRDVLDKHNIIIDSGISRGVVFILFFMIFLIVGMICIYLAINKSENVFNMVCGIIVGIVVCVIPIIISYQNVEQLIKVLNGKYIIVLDELMDKYYYNDHSYNGEGIDRSGWLLYFKDFFKTYNKYVKFKDWKEGHSYQEGDKFYLVFVKGNSIPYMFAANEYSLASSEKDKLKTLEEAEDYIKFEKFVLKKEVSEEKIVINKKRIIDDFFDKKEKNTILFYSLICIFLSAACIGTFFVYLIASIVLLLMSILFIYITIVKVKYLYSIINNIKNDKYETKIDEIISLNEELRYSDSNGMISFRFKDYNKVVYVYKKDYENPKIGDKFYLVFVKGEEEPIKVYDMKNSVLEDKN